MKSEEEELKPERVELVEKLSVLSSEEITSSLDDLDFQTLTKVLDAALTWLEGRAAETPSRLDDQILALIRRASGLTPSAA